MAERQLVVLTADYWFQHARKDGYSMAERLLFMENALNHTENQLAGLLRAKGKTVKPLMTYEEIMS